MSFKEKFIHELKAIFWTSLYFLIWIGVLVSLKSFLLAEYQIGFYEYSIMLVGALVGAKVVLIMENIPLGSWTKSTPAIVEILVRTLLYLLGVFIIMVLEKAFESRVEYGGFENAVKGLWGKTEFYHIIVNTICVFGALLGFNLWAVIKKHHGDGWLVKILSSPAPDAKK